MDKLVGTVSPKERDEIQNLFEKKNALENLTQIVNPKENEGMYERLLWDYQETLASFQQWWRKMTVKYGWNNQKCYIDFDTCNIYEKDGDTALH